MSFFRMFLGAFYSADTYREMRAKQGHGLLYSLWLVCLMSLCLVLFMAFSFHQAIFSSENGKTPNMEAILLQIAAQVPVMTLQDGKLQTNEPRAHEISVAWGEGEDEHTLLAVIDTTGATTHQNMPAPMLFDADELVIKTDKKTEIHSYADVKDINDGAPLIINRAMAEDVVKNVVAWVKENFVMIYAVIGGFMWLGMWFVFYLQRVVMLLVLAVGGIILAQILKTKVTFETLMRLAALSFTPVAVADIVSMIVGGGGVQPIWLVLTGLLMLGVALVVTRETPLAEAA